MFHFYSYARKRNFRVQEYYGSRKKKLNSLLNTVICSTKEETRKRESARGKENYF